MAKKLILNRRKTIAIVGGAGFSFPSLLKAQKYSAPGVYIEETGPGAPAIHGIETSIAAFVGVASSIQPENEIVSVSSFDEVKRYIGGREEKLFPTFYSAIKSFFENGGTRALIVNAGHQGGAYEDEGVPLLAKALDVLDGAKEHRFNLLYLPTAEKYFGDAMPELSALYARALSAARSRRAMLLIDGCENPADASAWRAGLGLDNPDVAAFAPRLMASDCQKHSFGAGGAVAGVITRTDQSRGVWKAPAGVEASIRGSLTQRQYTQSELIKLTQHNINAIREISASSAPVVWGARTLSSDPEWKYIPVRRYFHYLEASIEEGTHWVAFEPNDVALWSAVKTNVGAFMETQFRAGALAGTRPSESYYVRCGLGETMIQSDINNGRMVIDVGFAPLKPAEFVGIRITKKMTA